MKKYLRASEIFYCLLFLMYSCSADAFSFDSILKFFHKSTTVHAPNAHNIGNKHIVPPKEVKVGIYVLHVGKYDLQDANYQMDFYVILQCNPVCNGINFEVMNATDATIHLVAKPPGTLIYRVQANLIKSDNLRNYPFDNHVLELVIENRQLTSDKMVFVVDPKTTSLDSDLSMVGFKLLSNWTAMVTNHYYPVFQQSFSSYKFAMFIERPWLAGILKGILPALIFVTCNFLALFMKIEHTSQRLGIATSTLIAAAIFHLNLTASLPPLGYITYADMFMLINDLCLLIVLLEVVMTSYYVESELHGYAEYINKACAIIIPGIWLFLQFDVWIAFKPTAMINGLS